MQLPPVLRHQLFQLSFLILPILITTSLALTAVQFASTFNLHEPLNGPGGCDRKASNGVQILRFVIEAFTDASDMVTAVKQQIDSYNVDSSSSRRLRGLLFLFFGITVGDGYQLNPDSVANHTYVKGVFDQINTLLTAPRRTKAYRPWLNCLEDYAFYTEHLIGSDGRENRSAPLAAVQLGVKMPNGDYYPGLMYASAFPRYYNPDSDNPRGGQCGGTDTAAFSFWGPSVGWGITLCPAIFEVQNIADLGRPRRNTQSTEVINQYRNTGSVVALHELAHVIGPDIIDQPRVLPPNGDYKSQNWLEWTLDPTLRAYGYAQSTYLGLAKPKLGLLNAENYAVFALCVRYKALDCEGTYTSSILKREEVPFVPAPAAVRRIRQGGLTLPLGYAGGEEKNRFASELEEPIEDDI